MMEGNPIFEYSRHQAIEDGFLIDLSQEPFNKMARKVYKYPVAITSSVWAIIEAACQPSTGQSDSIALKEVEPILWDILYMSAKGSVEIDESSRSFVVQIPFDPSGDEFANLHAMKVICGPGDNLEPVVTIMLLDEID